MEKPGIDKSEETNTQINSNTKCDSNKKQVAEKANKHPEWLPDGWNVDVRIRKSGANMGSVYKCYIDPLKGYKFYSKPEVLRYLKTIKDNSCTSKEKKNCTKEHSPSNVVVEKSSVEDLPPGWTKEVKIRKNANGTRKDPFYRDPVSGYVFRSKKDVLRYLESGDIGTCAFKPSRRQIQDEDKSTPSPSAKRQKLMQCAPRQQLFVGKEICDKSSLGLPNANSSRKGQDVRLPSGMMDAPVPVGESVLKMHSLKDGAANPPDTRKTSDPDDVQEKEHAVNMVENANEKNNHNPSIANVRRRFSPRLAGIEPVQVVSDVMNEQAFHVPKRNLRKSRATLQLEKHESKEMDDEKSEPQLSLAFHYSWSDPSLESAINTLTGVLPAKDSVDNRPTALLENDFPKALSDNVTGSRDRNLRLEFATKLLAEGSVNNGPTAVLETDIQKTSFDSVAGRSRDRKPQLRSNKSKNRKELKLPIRLSKRLAGLEPEVLPSERAVEYTSRKSRKEEPIPTVTATAVLTNGKFDHVDTGEETTRTLHVSDSLQTGVLGESSNKSEKLFDAQTVPNEQLQKVEAENIYDERSEPQLPLPFGDPWSDPCLEFAFRTLTGALPVDAAADILPVMTPNVNDLPNKEVHESVVMTINEEAHDNSNQFQNKKELNMGSQPSKLLLGQPDLRTISMSCENTPTFTTTEFYGGEGNMTRILDGECLHSEARSETRLTHHSRNISTLIHEESLKENGQVLERENITMEQPPLETESLNHDNPESQFCASFMDSWSDPCLEFAFKTLTGALPVEENLGIEGCFQEPSNSHDRKDGGSWLPHFGSSSFSQSDISFNYDIGAEAIPGRQSSLSSSFLPLEKASQQGCLGVDPPKNHSQCNKNFQR